MLNKIVKYIGPTVISNMKYWVETGEFLETTEISSTSSGIKYLLTDIKISDRFLWTEQNNIKFY
jgi:hypothetical protein